VRENGEVRRRGEPYLTDEYDATRADLQHERERAADQVDRLENDIERIEAQLREKRAALAEVDLVVVREGHEANLDALSEGELELLGFVAALAGYEAFDVADATPVMLVDGVGGLAETNLHTLVESLRERTEYLVFTAYPEHSAVDGHEIDPAAWTIASDGVATAE
jgi:wobble nucleotide-excising tRNase